MNFTRLSLPFPSLPGEMKLYSHVVPLTTDYFVCVCVLRYIPQFICGDLDSAREEVLDFYKKKVSVLAIITLFKSA